MSDAELIQRIKGALGTDEDGENLVAVARAAHEAELQLADVLEEMEQQRMDRDLLD